MVNNMSKSNNMVEYSPNLGDIPNSDIKRCPTAHLPRVKIPAENS